VSKPPNRPGFLATLFDATFSHLLALRLVRVLYLLALLFIGTYGFVALFLGISQGGLIALLSVVAVPFLALLAVALVRVALEALVVLFRMGEQTDRMARMLYTMSVRPRPRDQTEPNSDG
jgi:hypothetical protein